MSISPHKDDILDGIVTELKASAVNLFTDNVFKIPRNANVRAFCHGVNKMILVRDGGATKDVESTNSTVFKFRVDIAAIDLKGDMNRTAATSRIMEAARDIGTELHRNTGIYNTASEWIERAVVTDIPQTEEIWSDLVEQINETPFVMAPVTVEYDVFCREA